MHAHAPSADGRAHCVAITRHSSSLGMLGGPHPTPHSHPSLLLPWPVSTSRLVVAAAPTPFSSDLQSQAWGQAWWVGGGHVTYYFHSLARWRPGGEAADDLFLTSQTIPENTIQKIKEEAGPLFGRGNSSAPEMIFHARVGVWWLCSPAPGPNQHKLLRRRPAADGAGRSVTCWIPP